jgi:hypothetical protein
LGRAGDLLAAFILFSEQFSQPIELSFPGSAVIANPLLEEAKAGGFNAAGAYSAQLFCAHEANLFEDLQVLRDGGKRDAEGICESRNRRRAAGEMVEDRATRGISQRMEQTVDLRVLRGHVRLDFLRPQLAHSSFSRRSKRDRHPCSIIAGPSGHSMYVP